MIVIDILECPPARAIVTLIRATTTITIISITTITINTFLSHSWCGLRFHGGGGISRGSSSSSSSSSGGGTFIASSDTTRGTWVRRVGGGVPNAHQIHLLGEEVKGIYIYTHTHIYIYIYIYIHTIHPSIHHQT